MYDGLAHDAMPSHIKVAHSARGYSIWGAESRSVASSRGQRCPAHLVATVDDDNVVVADAVARPECTCDELRALVGLTPSEGAAGERVDEPDRIRLSCGAVEDELVDGDLRERGGWEYWCQGAVDTGLGIVRHVWRACGR